MSKSFEEIVSEDPFRGILHRELESRCRKNPRYSLRAFARSIGIGPAALSDMINCKRPISDKSVERIGLSLGIPIEELEKFKKNKSKLSSRRMSSAKYETIDFDSFSIISDWYHYAILELMKIESFEPNLKWISKSLGITKSQASIAVQRLVRMGYISVESNGSWVDTSSGSSTNIVKSALTTAAKKKLQRQILEQSAKALEEVQETFRNHTSMTLAMDPKDLPEAVAIIAEFRRSLTEYLESKKSPKQVYQLAISLFPISNQPKQENK